MKLGGVVVASGAEFLSGVLRRELAETFSRHVIMAKTKTELQTIIETAYPSLLFLEYCFDGQATGELVKQLVKAAKTLRIVMWSAEYIAPAAASRFILAGAESYISLRSNTADIQTILKLLLLGKPYIPSDVEAVLNKADCVTENSGNITAREKEIIRYTIVEGKQEQEIAQVMGIKICTVKMHKANLFNKCNGRSILHLLRFAFQNSVVFAEDFITITTGGKNGCKD